MKKAYLAISFNERENYHKEIKALSIVFKKNDVALFVFVDRYHFLQSEANEMMEQAKKEIESSDFLIAEVSHKAIGVGIEVGYASALKKKIIYIRKDKTEHSTTVSGISDYELTYTNIVTLEQKLNKILPAILK